MSFQSTRIMNVSSDCALSSVVEHYLHTVGVAGSKPAARTILRWNAVKAKDAAPKCSVGGLCPTNFQNWSVFSLNSTLNVVSEP